MISILLVSHSNFAEGLHSASKILLGEIPNFKYITFDDLVGVENLKDEIESLIINTKSPLLIFTDLKGGTPFNVVSILTKNKENIKNIYGMNLPMVLESILMRDQFDLEDLVKHFISIREEAIGLSEL